MVKRFGEFHWTFCVLNRIGKEEETMVVTLPLRLPPLTQVILQTTNR